MNWACKTEQEIYNPNSPAIKPVNHIIGFLNTRNDPDIKPIDRAILKHMYCYITVKSTDTELNVMLYQERMKDFPQILED